MSKVKEKRTALILLMILCSVLVSFPEMGILQAESRMIVVPDDYSTIQEAVDNADEGDTVFVKKGIYYESVLINKSLSLIGQDAGTMIRGDYRLNGTIVLIRHDNGNVDGLTIQSSERRSSRRGIHLLHVRYCNVSGNTISNCGCGIWLYGASQNSIAGNNLADNIY